MLKERTQRILDSTRSFLEQAHPRELKVSRRGSLRLATGIVTAALLAGCSLIPNSGVVVPSCPEGETSWPQMGRQLVDKASNHPLLNCIVIELDPSYKDPEYPGGPSIKVTVVTNKKENNAEVRFSSSQVEPAARAGDLLNSPYPLVSSGTQWHPVTGLDQGERDTLRIGTKQPGEPCLNSYLMRVYDLSWIGKDALEGNYLGEQQFQPGDFKPREPNLAKYFKPKCLTREEEALLSRMFAP